jgi:flavorubredoxin
MDTRTDEIADGIYRISTMHMEVSPPMGMSFNEFLILGDEPMLFHCGHRAMFPQISAAVARVVPLDRLRWIAYSHVEADECGALDEWLAAAPSATVAHGAVGCNIWLNDAAARKPRSLVDNEVLDLGGKRIRHLDTPHVPHGWDARMLFEESTGTLLCSDLFGHVGSGPAMTESDIVGPAIVAQSKSKAMSLTPATVPTLRRLAALRPERLALMHGSSYAGDAAAALGALADHFTAELRTSFG